MEATTQNWQNINSERSHSPETGCWRFKQLRVHRNLLHCHPQTSSVPIVCGCPSLPVESFLLLFKEIPTASACVPDLIFPLWAACPLLSVPSLFHSSFFSFEHAQSYLKSYKHFLEIVGWLHQHHSQPPFFVPASSIEAGKVKYFFPQPSLC